MSAVDYGREALDFIEGLEAYRRVPSAMNALEGAFGRFGFETIIVTGLPNPDQRFAQMVLAKRGSTPRTTTTASTRWCGCAGNRSTRSSGRKRPMIPNWIGGRRR